MLVLVVVVDVVGKLFVFLLLFVLCVIFFGVVGCDMICDEIMNWCLVFMYVFDGDWELCYMFGVLDLCSIFDNIYVM